MAGSPTVVTGARSIAGTQGVLAAGLMPDKDVNVAQVEENTSPLLLITRKLNRKKSIQPTFTHFENEPLPYWDALNEGSGRTDSDTSITVDNGTYFGANFLVLVPRTDEIFRVTSVSSNVLTAVRGVAGTSNAAMLDNDDLRIIGTAYAGGSAKGTLKSTKKTEVTGQCQIFRTPYGVTGSEEAADFYWGDDLKEERSDHAVDHAIDIESSFIFGKASIDTTGATPIWFTGGVINAITTNSLAVNGFLDLDTMDSFIRTGFRYSSTRGRKMKWFFCSRVVASAINAFARDQLRTVPSDTVFGISMQRYDNIHGNMVIIPHSLLEDNPLSAGTQTEKFGGYGLLVDPSSPQYRYLQGKDTRLIRRGWMIKTTGDDVWEEEYYSQCGLQFKVEERNSLMTGVTG